MSNENHQWMEVCLELAEQAALQGEVPVGAVVISAGRIIGRGYNQSVGSGDPTAHAEIMALRDACARVGNYRLPEASLYVSVEPCTMCAGALVHARVKRLVFGATEPRAGAIISRARVLDSDYLNHSVEYTGGCMETECGRLMQDFFQSRRGCSER